MSERPRVLVELGDELDRAARRTLAGRRTRFGAPPLGGVMAALAAVSAVAIAVVAILVIGYHRPASGTAGSRRPGASAPRGEIVDRDGRVLVGSRRAIDLQIVPAALPVPLPGRKLSDLLAPPNADQAVYDRLASTLGISLRRRRCVIPRHTVPLEAQLTAVACDVGRAVYRFGSANVTLASDVKPVVAHALASLPGVRAPTVSVTSYPYRGLAAQVLGSVGPITPAELKAPQFTGVAENAVVGQTGLEYFYDRYLRGRDTLETSLDLRLERVGQSSLATSIAHNAPGGAGAFVAMDPQNGQIYAMGSLPTYDANVFTRPISNSAYARLIRPKADEPLVDRAIAGEYPTGSPLKPITAAAALASGTWRLGDTYDDTGAYCLGGLCLHNSGHVANGVLNLVSAIRVSDDVFFYNLGAKLNVDPQNHPLGGALQQWARLFGIGQATGVDLPYEVAGNLPDPQWRAKRTIANPGPWTVGDNVNLAVGQGSVLVTPLQLAVTYSAIANGGTVVRPHVGSEVLSANGGQVVEKVASPPVRHISLNPVYLAAIRAGLRAAASQPGGTSTSVMSRLPEAVSGEAGTAQTFPHGRESDQAWYVGYVPATATNKPIVVVVTVEKGGFGAVAAAPVARQILSQWFLGRPGPYIPGTSTTL